MGLECLVFANSHFEILSTRVLGDGLKVNYLATYGGKINKSRDEKNRSDAKEQTRLNKLSQKLGIPKETCEFWSKVALLYRDLVAYSYLVEEEESQKLWRRNFVWIFRDQCFGGKDGTKKPSWKELEEESTPYKRAKLFLEAHRLHGLEAAYELRDLEHPKHKEIGTEDKNTTRTTLSRWKDVSVSDTRVGELVE